MRPAYWIATFAFGFVVIGGCQNKKPADPAELSARVDAASQIMNVSDRDDALAAACKDAARAGADGVVLKGVKQINNISTRDQVAADCALKLRDKGQTSSANEVAKLINNVSKRDEVLKKLASGP